MNFTIEFFRVRSTDDSHATLDRISVAADNLEAAKVKAKSLFETLNMPQKPDGLRILVQEERELFVWSRGATMPKPEKCPHRRESLQMSGPWDHVRIP